VPPGQAVPSGRAVSPEAAESPGSGRAASPGEAEPGDVAGQFTQPDGVRTERQGDAVAKSRLGKGLADRVGWRRSADVDAEMWPEEGFGGVSDEQFWDDLASDKPLTTTARTAQPDGGPPRSRIRRAESRSVESRSVERGAAPPVPGAVGPGTAGPGAVGPGTAVPGAAVPGTGPTQTFPVGQRQSGPQPAYQTGPQQIQGGAAAGYPGSAIASAQGTTQAFKIPAAQQDQVTGPQPVRSVTPPERGPAPERGSLPERGLLPERSPLPERGPAQRQQYRPPQSAPSRPLMQPPTQPQSQSYQASQPLPIPLPSAPSGRSTPGHGRHGAAEDPLTSSAYSIRSGDGSVDGRSYQASRRARELTREQYDAAISQETQMFSAVEDGASGGYQSSTPAYGYDLAPRHGSAPGSGQSANGGAPGSHRSTRRDVGNGHGGSSGYPYQYPQQSQTGPHGPGSFGQGSLPPSPLPQAPPTHTTPHGVEYGDPGYRGGDDPGWGSGARDYDRPAINGRDQGRDQGRGAPLNGAGDVGYGEPSRGGHQSYQDGSPEAPSNRSPAALPSGSPYQDGYPGPYDPRNFDRR
jgi:hypothetical protein